MKMFKLEKNYRRHYDCRAGKKAVLLWLPLVDLDAIRGYAKDLDLTVQQALGQMIKYCLNEMARPVAPASKKRS